MIIIGLAGKNRISKGSCALYLHQHRQFSIVLPDDNARIAPLYGAAGRVVVSNIRSETEAAFIRECGGIIVHVIAPRDGDHYDSGLNIPAGDFVLHGCATDPLEMHAQLDRIVLDHELSMLTEVRHAIAG